MTLTLTDALTRLRALLVDSGSVGVWSEETLTAGLRQALAEASLAAAADCAGEVVFTLAGLDGAGETSLPARLEGLLCWGAAGYAAVVLGLEELGRQRLLPQGIPLREWGEQRLKEFRFMLAAEFPAYAPAAGLPGCAAAPDPARAAAETALLEAQSARAAAEAELAAAQAAHAAGQEQRAAAAAAQSALDRQAEAARQAMLRAQAAANPWGRWEDGTDG